VFLNEPARTNFDINFTLLGFPVRVHPAFFVLPLVLGSGFLSWDGVNAGVVLLVLTIVFFVSILVHELGHAIAMRYYGHSPRILIYWMGGLAIVDGFNVWGGRRSLPLNGFRKVVVSLAGPAFGFALAVLIAVLTYAIGGKVRLDTTGLIPSAIPDLRGSVLAGNLAVGIALAIGLWANIFWNVLNLAPVFPLDGGQIARELFVMQEPWNGIKYSMVLSIVTAIVIAVFGFQSGHQFLGVFFGFMAWNNYVELQRTGGGFGGRRPW
jgi:Zn-dependent protease